MNLEMNFLLIRLSKKLILGVLNVYERKTLTPYIPQNNIICKPKNMSGKGEFEAIPAAPEEDLRLRTF